MNCTRLGRHHFICGLLFLFAATGSLSSESCLAQASAQRPNIVFILIDDMGWPDLTCYGHKFHETPRLDQLAREGVRLTNFYAATPVCSSTRSTIQTGQYSARTGITDFIPGHFRPYEKLAVPPIRHQLQTGTQTIGQGLQSAGYATGYFGKWHLGGHPGGYGYAVTEKQLGKDFQSWRTNKRAGPKKIDLLTDQTLWFIEQQKERPFFVTLSHYAVHIRLEARQKTLEKYKRKPAPQQGVNNRAYAAMIEDLDRSIGRILDKLTDLKLAQNTLVVVTSDNGGLQKIFSGRGEIVSTNAPLRDEKGTLYEGGIRVPMIVRWPGVVPKDKVCLENGTTADLLPTFFEAAQVKLPKNRVDGISLLPVLRSPEADLQREAIYFHYPHYHHSRPAGAIRSGDWKLIEFFDTEELELYHLKEDIGESENLAATQAVRAKQLHEKLRKWRKEIGAKMPTENPDYDPDRAGQWYRRSTKRPLNPESLKNRYRSQPVD